MKQQGFSLVELMVSLVIGLILVIAASAIFLYSKQGFNAVAETSQLEENGRFAINFLSRYIRSAGNVMMDPASQEVTTPMADKISGCDFGMTNPLTATSAADLACRTATPNGERRSASIALFSQTDEYASNPSRGTDCLGGASIALPVGALTTHIIRSYFFVAVTNQTTSSGASVPTGQLYCLADRTNAAGVFSAAAQPILPGIEQVAFNYLLPAAADANTAQAAVSAASATADAQWPTVMAVDVCVLAKSVQPSANDSTSNFTDCYGSTITASQGEVYRTFRSTVLIRNKSQ